MTDRAGTHVVLLATGGTISSRARSAEDGAAVAADGGAQVLRGLAAAPAYPVRVVDVVCEGSYLLTLVDMIAICAQIKIALSDPSVRGVVVTHGTDTMEETAYLADLTHDDVSPVVFTGAQKSADAAEPDGPGNLADAIAVAGSPAAAGLGALIVFAGEIFPARGVRKAQTFALDAFTNPDFGVVGFLTATGDVVITRHEQRMPPLPLPLRPLREAKRVDVVSAYPGADGILLRASVSAGASGIVLQATGSGNANPALCSAVAAATARGTVVVTSTRVSAGPVIPVYGAGGGRDLVAAGAIPAGFLRPSQSMILLSLLLHLDHDHDEIAHAFALYGAANTKSAQIC
ncbi:L-asparaginase [Cryobacterium sp. CAN_C3]|uniref:asparaginase n=1 Tax=unclassified Cryobacterium TaxID=2649013 RepID=UPI001A2711A5|nr:L-asparaginase [Cryobacterium sp. CAN_C3]